MRPLTITIALILLLPGEAVAGEKRPDPRSPDFPRYVMRKLDDLYRGASSQGVMEMKVKTKHWSRAMALESWSLGKDYTLVRILRPRKERGTATLKARNDLFIYLNKTGKTIKITSGMMGGSWMGSHFTNDDLIKHSRFARDYDIKLSGQGEQGGAKTYRFTLKAKRDAAVVWDRLVVTVRRSDLQPLRQEFYDEDGKKVRVLTLAEHRDLGGRVMPLRMTMKPTDKPGELTEVRWTKIRFDVNLDKGFFTLQKLRSR
jgi:outer membrane lipoprotein-sorting protein